MHLLKSIDAGQPAQSAQADLGRNCLLLVDFLILKGVYGRLVELRPRNLKVPSSIRREHWCSSQESKSREISMSCKNLFLNRCEMNMFKINHNSTGCHGN